MTEEKKDIKKVLVIRSVSFQQLDKNLPRIMKRFPGSEFYLLTHTHGTNRAKKYAGLAGIIDYSSRKNFTFSHLPRECREAGFDAVVVPVTNQTGAGFLNVFLMALRVGAGEYYCCNMVSEIWKVPRWKTIGRFLGGIFYSGLSVIFSALLVVLLPLLLPISLLKKK